MIFFSVYREIYPFKTSVTIHGSNSGILVGFTEISLLFPYLFFIGHYFNNILYYSSKKLVVIDAHGKRTYHFIL